MKNRESCALNSQFVMIETATKVSKFQQKEREREIERVNREREREKQKKRNLMKETKLNKEQLASDKVQGIHGHYNESWDQLNGAQEM